MFFHVVLSHCCRRLPSARGCVAATAKCTFGLFPGLGSQRRSCAGPLQAQCVCLQISRHKPKNAVAGS